MNIKLSVDEHLKLKKQRKILKLFITRVRNNIIDLMGLSESPDPCEQKETGKRKTTTEDIDERIANAFKKQKESNEKKMVELSDDDDEESYTTPSNSSKSKSSSTQSTTKSNNNNITTSVPTNKCPPKYQSSRWSQVSHNLPQDLYITQEKTLCLLDEVLSKLPRETIFFDPVCGLGAFGHFLRSRHFKNIIERDLYTVPVAKSERCDYLKTEDPHYDVLIANFPFCIKLSCFEKAVKSGILFIIIITIISFNILCK